MIQGDTGFDELQRDYVNVETPHKKTKGGELTSKQKQENRALAKERVVVEHSFSSLKRYRIENFDDRTIVTAAGLWNFYLMVA